MHDEVSGKVMPEIKGEKAEHRNVIESNPGIELLSSRTRCLELIFQWLSLLWSPPLAGDLCLLPH